MEVNPCSVCGGTDLNLVDGFYYCVECGTQDVNAQETVVEQTTLADGTFAHAASKRFTTVLKEGIEMSGEWNKWHTFNFILCGLADELESLGAKPSFKMKVLWVWARYIKKFQVKEDDCEASQLFDEDERINTKASLYASKDDDIENSDEENTKSSEKRKNNKSVKDISVITSGVLLAILYAALNLDRSEMQLSHLLRYIKDGRVSISDYNKFIPKELNIKSIPHWKSFSCCTRINNSFYIRTSTMSVFNALDLGIPLLPDLRKFIDNYVKELSLPSDFKNLVFSIMHLAPCNLLDIECYKGLVRMPDFEGVAMAYVLVALKMCFGLDDDYEIKLSNVVDQINKEENYMKSHKLGMVTEPTDRLFSFREWCNYLQFRKTMLCKYNLLMAKQHGLDVDDYVFMEQSEERPKRKIELSDEVTMDILNKIQLVNDIQVIPKSEFSPSLTPISTYTDVIIQYVRDPELKLLISEDFTQYSLKYACVDLKLLFEEQNIIIGVNETNKTVNPVVVGTLVCKKADKTLVYVRNCENKNWLKTKPTTEDHVTQIEDNSNLNAKDSDLGYDSNIDSPIEVQSMADNNLVEVTSMSDNTPVEVASMADNTPVKVASMTDDTKANMQDDIDETERELEAMQEEDIDKLIFDDTFEDVIDIKKQDIETDSLEFNYETNEDFHVSLADIDDSKSDTSDLISAAFNPVTFDREKTIKELILTACKKYKIPIPREYNTKEPRKRKPTLVHIGAGQSDAKRRKVTKRAKPGEAKKALNGILAAYYENVGKDVLNQVSEHVNSLLNNLHIEGLPELEEELESKSAITLNDSMISNQNDKSISQDNDEQNTNITGVDGAQNAENNVTVNSDEDEEDLIPKTNPKFDTKTYDASQLYIKFKEEVNLEDIFDYDDPDLEKLIDNKICEFAEIQPNICPEDLQEHDLESDSEDDIPLANIQNKMKLLRERKLQMKNLQPLIKTPKNLKNFNYWFRHYTTALVTKNIDMHQRFDLELKANCPSSFNFVIHECASILDCTTFSLYKHMQDIEKLLNIKASKR